MKCVHIKNHPETTIRIKNSEATKLVEEDNYVYCPKSVWKKLVRHQGAKETG